MFEIVSRRELSPNIVEMKVNAPRVAASARPGQFVIVRTDTHGERIPLTICDFDTDDGTVTIVTQAIGHSSRKIINRQEGDAFADFAGPLGNPSDLLQLPQEELEKKRILFVAGGVGTAPVYPQVKWLKEHGVVADVVIGAKSKDLFTYVDEMKTVGNVYLCTDDGSEGFQGMVTGLMKDLIDNQGKRYDHCVIIGPHDNDEIRIHDHKGIRHPDDGVAQRTDGRRHRNVRRMSRYGRRTDPFHLRGGSGV